MDDDKQHQTKGVGDNMALATFDSLSRVIAGNSAAFRGFDALAINHTSCWVRFTSLKRACAHDQKMIDCRPESGVAPGVELSTYS